MSFFWEAAIQRKLALRNQRINRQTIYFFNFFFDYFSLIQVISFFKCLGLGLDIET